MTSDALDTLEQSAQSAQLAPLAPFAEYPESPAETLGPVGNLQLVASMASLSETFRTPFRLWERQEISWTPLVPLEYGEEPCHGDLELDVPLDCPDTPTHLAAWEQAGAVPQLDYLADDRYFLTVSIGNKPGSPIAATAVIRTTDPHLVLQLAELRVGENDQGEQLGQLREENEAFARQVTESFQELMFFREMSQKLEVVDLTRSVLQMAHSIAPMLAQSARAETIVIVSARSEDGAHDDRDQVGDVVLWHGPKTVDMETCQQIVHQFKNQCKHNAVIKNHRGDLPAEHIFDGVRELVIAAMMTHGYRVGWLLALNRVPPFGYEDEPIDFTSDCMEFGTCEASLLSSAAALMAAHARNVEMFHERQDLLTNVVSSLVYAIEAKDDYTCGHSERVALFSSKLGQRIGLDNETCERLHLIGLLHDVGKIGVRDATLNKTGKLTNEEFDEIKQHPDGAWTILHHLEPLRDVLPGVLFHHERYDGTGYPDGLEGEEIPLAARILAIADAFDAMTSDRSYRQGMETEKASLILQQGSGTQWDPQLVQTFLEIMPEITEIRQTYSTRLRPPRRTGSVLVDD